MRIIRAKNLTRNGFATGKNLQENIDSNYPIREALRPILGFDGIFHHAAASGILDHCGWLVAWENHKGETHRSHVLGTQAKAEEFMAEILAGDNSHPSFAPVRLNIRVEPEKGLHSSIIQEDADGNITNIKARY
jgi:hypothetical protein